MAFEKRADSGALFKNDKKTADNHPNAKGDALIGRVEYWVSGWTKVGKNGIKYQSLSFKAKDEAKPKHDDEPF